LPANLLAVTAKAALPSISIISTLALVLPTDAVVVATEVRLPSSADDLPPPPDPVDPPPVTPPPAPDPGGVIQPAGGLYIEPVVSVLIGGVAVAPTAITLAGDLDSWAWRCSLAFAGLEAVALLEANPTAIIEVSVNAYRWLFNADEYNQAHGFNSFGSTVTGRSPSGSLAKPTATPRDRVVTVARTARQLAADELASTGWVLDWQIVNWLVPANAFQYRQLAPIESITAIASAVGGVVLTDRESNILRVAPRYPSPVWALDNSQAVHTIAADRAFGYAVKNQTPPRYTAIFVSGGSTGGIYAKVRRPGVAENLAPSVSDPLITHADAARARGIAELSTSCLERTVSFDTPLASNPASRAPLLPPGTQVASTYPNPDALWNGIVAACQIVATVDNQGAITVTQSVEIHRYG
jgi:hypothetical protein